MPGEIHVSRDVVFEEEKEWRWSEDTNSDVQVQSWVTFTVENDAAMQVLATWNHFQTGSRRLSFWP